jgi:hypothetical protein
MVTINPYAGTGNQMFMVAAVIGYAKRHNLEYHIPPTTVNPRVWQPAFTHLTNKNYSRFAPTVNIKERQHNYKPLPFDSAWVDSNITLEGFWQSEKYFEGAENEVKAAFNLPYEAIDFVGIQVRRGDYLKYPTKHPAVNYDYLRHCIITFLNQGKNSFVVCSDDIPWCKEKFSQLKKELGVNMEFSYSENNTPLNDIALLSCCTDNIISNSTFGWWGAWLNPNPDKIVLVPSESNWFGSDNKHLSVIDLIPDSWTQIEY